VVTIAGFPIPDKVMVPLAPIVDVASRSMEFVLIHFDASLKGR
jgi:hypothetical protein